MANEKDTGLVTVATVRKGEEGDEILFNERQQIFTLATAIRTREGSLSSLKNKMKKDEPVRVVLNTRKPVIERIEEPDEREVELFRKYRKLEEKPSKPVRIDVREIDPSLFNIVDYKLKWPPFLLCEKVIPSYSKAKEIFDYCAQQSCHLPGPYDISPCIPFQYVRDGCYARAHKMRRIITTKYRYCCEKVFSFANQGSDRLAVKANKWGGCCVTWWYHVAPLVRVRIKIFTFSFNIAMVIDPGMFDKPVLLSSWLGAQQLTACHANARVSMYSIQPGSAYTPANYAGTAFSTDPTYSLTDATLNAYSGLTTC
jgi:hypothetical protein